MYDMFSNCLSLKELNISNFNINDITSVDRMFDGCTDELKKKIKEQNNNNMNMQKIILLLNNN